MRLFFTILVLCSTAFADEYSTQQAQVLIAKIESMMAQTTRHTVKKGSMTKPYKTITIDIYQETTVDVEARQKLMLEILAKMAQLQEVETNVDHKFKAVVR